MSYYNAGYIFPQIFNVSYLCVRVYVYGCMYSVCVCVCVECDQWKVNE